MKNMATILGILALAAAGLSCGDVVTPQVLDPTTYVPPTVVPAATEYVPPPVPPTVLPPTAYVPPAITPSLYVPPTITACPTTPPTITPTIYKPPTIVPTGKGLVGPGLINATALLLVPIKPTIFLPQPINPQIITYITQKYWSLGSEKSVLGSPIGTEQMAAGGTGYYRQYQWGVIYWSKDSGAYEVHGAIYAKWAELGFEQSFLGYPLTDETSTPDGIGRFNHFQGGSIYWTPNTGAHEVHGNIRVRWSELGWELSCLGYPISDEEPAGGEYRQSRFEHGVITWSPSQGAVETCY